MDLGKKVEREADDHFEWEKPNLRKRIEQEKAGRAPAKGKPNRDWTWAEDTQMQQRDLDGLKKGEKG